MSPLLVTAVDLVLPGRCAGCSRPGHRLCPACVPRRPATPVPAAEPATWAAGRYEGGLRRAVLAYKERGRHDLARPLAELLADAVRAALAGGDLAVSGVVCLVPVPSSRRAARERGGDHVLRLARIAARRTGRPVVPALGLAREVHDSAGLGRAARAANLSGAFTAIPPPGRAEPRAVLVDDIVTTGATLREARRALECAGWLVPAAAVIAATPRRAGVDRPVSARSGTRAPRELA